MNLIYRRHFVLQEFCFKVEIMDDSEDELVVNRSNIKTYSRNSVEFMEDDSEIQIYEEVKVKEEPLEDGKGKNLSNSLCVRAC